MGGQRRAFAAIALACALLAGCAADPGSGIRCDLPENTRLVPAPDGGMQVQLPNGSTGLLTFANGACVFNRPISAGNRPVIDEADLDFTYDYYRQSLAGCLDELGFRTLAPPSRETFVASGGNWSPYDSVFSPLLSSEQIATIARVCPEAPPRH
jgi:hypothetical protein